MQSYDRQIGPRLYARIGLDSNLRSSSSLSRTSRGHSSESHRSLILLSNARHTASMANALRPSAANWQNWRPHLRQVYVSRDPRTADQSSILTIKSWVAQLLVACVIVQPISLSHRTGGLTPGSQERCTFASDHPTRLIRLATALRWLISDTSCRLN